MRHSPRPGDDERRPGSARVAAVVLGSLLAVPLTLSLLTDEVFAVPKLLVVAAVTVAGAWCAVRDGARMRFVPTVDGALAIFLGLSLISVATSVDPLHSVAGERLQRQGAGTLLLYAGGFLLARMSLEGGRARALLAPAMTLAGSVVAGYAVLQAVGLDPIWRSLPGGRVTSTIGQPNALAALLVITLPFAPATAGRSRRLTSVAVAAGAGLQVAALLLTASRGGALGAVVAAIVIVVVMRRRIRRVPVRRAAAAGGAAILVGLAVSLPAAGRLVERLHGAASVDGSVQGHLDLWRVGIAVAADHPLLGTGPDTFPLVFPAYRDEVLPPERAVVFRPYRLESPHNVYVSVAAGSGLPAAAAYIAFLAACLRTIWATVPGDRERAALMAAGAGHLVTDIFVTAEISSAWLFWTMLGAGVASRGSRRDRGRRRWRTSQVHEPAPPPGTSLVASVGWLGGGHRRGCRHRAESRHGHAGADALHVPLRHLRLGM